ncbi:hypothetical protein B7P43_G15373, partial [Cryptotermes secundus]
ITFCLKLGKSTTETLQVFHEAFGHSCFKAGRVSVEDGERSGRLNTSKTTEKFKKLENSFTNTVASYWRRLMRAITIITGYVSWIYGYDPETKWGTENPHVVIQHERDSPQVNVLFAISKKKVYGPISFAEPTVSTMIYLDMLEDWLMPQLNEDINDYLLQQDGCPGRTGQEDDALMLWPPVTVFVPPLPANLRDLRNLITDAGALINRDMLTRVWDKMDYRIDVCHLSIGGHIERL